MSAANEPGEAEARGPSLRAGRGAASGGTGVMVVLVLSGLAMAVAIYGLLRW